MGKGSAHINFYFIIFLSSEYVGCANAFSKAMISAEKKVRLVVRRWSAEATPKEFQKLFQLNIVSLSPG